MKMMSAENMTQYTARVDQMDVDQEEELKRPDPFPYSESEDIPLPVGYKPTKHDIINGRGRKSYNHLANRRFRQLIAMNISRYVASRCKVDKTLVVVGIVNTIRHSTPTGGFLKRCAFGRWVSMSNESAREKVGHCLRDMIASHRIEKEKKPTGQGFNNTQAETRSLNSLGVAKIRQQASSLNASWLTGSVGAEGSILRPSSLARGQPFAGMWSAVKNEITSNDHPYSLKEASLLSLPRSMNRSANPPPPAIAPFSFGNLAAMKLQKGNQDMSEQQRRILVKLESGFKGSVEELIEAVK